MTLGNFFVIALSFWREMRYNGIILPMKEVPRHETQQRQPRFDSARLIGQGSVRHCDSRRRQQLPANDVQPDRHLLAGAAQCRLPRRHQPRQPGAEYGHQLRQRRHRRGRGDDQPVHRRRQTRNGAENRQPDFHCCDALLAPVRVGDGGRDAGYRRMDGRRAGLFRPRGNVHASRRP